MDKQKNSGFTIIEVIMFLAISSLLGVGILASASASINTQRYQDSVRSFYSHLQTEYSRVSNVENSRDGRQFSCSPEAAVVEAGDGAAAQARGTSNCSIVGRVVDVADGGAVIHSEPVYATVNVMDRTVPPTTDEAALEQSGLVIAPTTSDDPELNRTNYQLEWQTKVVDSEDGVLPLRLLIVRSPLSGMIRTYAKTGPGIPELGSPSSITSLIGQTEEVTACVSPAGLFSGLRQTQGVIVAARASGTAGLSLTEGDAC